MLPQYVISVRKLKEGDMNLDMATDGMDASLEEGRGLGEAGGHAGPSAAAAAAYARATPQSRGGEGGSEEDTSEEDTWDLDY